MSNWRCGKCDYPESDLGHSRRCSKNSPSATQRCGICGEFFGNILVCYDEDISCWCHWHCIMNKNEQDRQDIEFEKTGKERIDEIIKESE